MSLIKQPVLILTLAALTASATAVTLTGERNGAQGNTFTWVLSGEKIASLHIVGQETGDNSAQIGTPNGWSFTGTAQSGDYSWESPVNLNGTYKFVMNHSFGVGIATPTSAQYDYIDDQNQRVLVTIPITPVPEPTTLAAIGIGLFTLLKRRKTVRAPLRKP